MTGLGTAPDTLRRGSDVLALLNLEGADASVDDALMGLAQRPPVRPLTRTFAFRSRQVGSSQRASEGDLDHLIDQAIATRPKSPRRWRESKPRCRDPYAKSEYFPKIGSPPMSAKTSAGCARPVERLSSVTQPMYGVGLKFQSRSTSTIAAAACRKAFQRGGG